MHYVYLIRSISNPNQTYIGNTENLKQRLETHNSGGSKFTKPYRPWQLILFLGFKDKLKATAFAVSGEALCEDGRSISNRVQEVHLRKNDSGKINLKIEVLWLIQFFI